MLFCVDVSKDLVPLSLGSIRTRRVTKSSFTLGVSCSAELMWPVECQLLETDCPPRNKLVSALLSRLRRCRRHRRHYRPFLRLPAGVLSSGLYLRVSRSQWPCGLRRGAAAARLLGLRVRILPGTWISVCCECRLSSRREVSVLGCSLFQRSPTKCGVSEYDREASTSHTCVSFILDTLPACVCFFKYAYM